MERYQLDTCASLDVKKRDDVREGARRGRAKRQSQISCRLVFNLF